MLRTVLAEDNLLVREGVRGILGAAEDIDVVGVCGDADTLRALIRQVKPDVVVTDIHMPPGFTNEGIQVARELRREAPGIGVVVLSSRDDPQHALDLLEDGASGRSYLLKERVAQAGQLVDAIREVAAGRSVIDAKIVEGLVRAGGRSESSPLTSLTPREREVLSEMAMGRNNNAIAQRLFLTVRGVERHINTLFSKLGLADEQDSHSRVRAVLLYLAEH